MKHSAQSEPTTGPSRRQALKVGVAATASAAIWAEPTIKGLARRPAYAATGSGAPVTFDLTDFPVPFEAPNNLTQSITVDGVTLTVERLADIPGMGSTTAVFTFTVAGGADPYTLAGTVTFTSANNAWSATDAFENFSGPQTLEATFGRANPIPRINLSTTITCE